MSTLFDIRVEMVVGPTVWVRFEVCHPDQWDVPASKAIALLMILEVYREMKEGLGFHHNNDRPMSKAVAAELITHHPRKGRMDEWLSYYTRFDGSAFGVAAEEAILDVELMNEEGNPKKEEGDPHPRATLVIAVRDASILAHMVGGFNFDSAMCDSYMW